MPHKRTAIAKAEGRDAGVRARPAEESGDRNGGVGAQEPGVKRDTGYDCQEPACVRREEMLLPAQLGGLSAPFLGNSPGSFH